MRKAWGTWGAGVANLYHGRAICRLKKTPSVSETFEIDEEKEAVIDHCNISETSLTPKHENVPFK